MKTNISKTKNEVFFNEIILYYMAYSLLHILYHWSSDNESTL